MINKIAVKEVNISNSSVAILSILKQRMIERMTGYVNLESMMEKKKLYVKIPSYGEVQVKSVLQTSQGSGFCCKRVVDWVIQGTVKCIVDYFLYCKFHHAHAISSTLP